MFSREGGGQFMTETNDGWEQWDLFGNLAEPEQPTGAQCRCGARDGEPCREGDPS